MRQDKGAERLLWSIALPGFGQILNGDRLKGFLFIALEILINMGARLNLAIVASFHGNTVQAIELVDYQWLMFYPCLYAFAAWDAYKNAAASLPPYSFLPFVAAAYGGTVGVTLSPSLQLLRIKPGPVWLPIAGLALGAAAGRLIQRYVQRRFPAEAGQ